MKNFIFDAVFELYSLLFFMPRDFIDNDLINLVIYFNQCSTFTPPKSIRKPEVF